MTNPNPATDAARAVWFLGLLAKRMIPQPEGGAVLVLPDRYVIALAAYDPNGDTAVYGQPCPLCGGHTPASDDVVPPDPDDDTDANDRRGEETDSRGRAAVIANGQLIDVTEMAAEAGFRLPVALTRAAWVRVVEWSDAEPTFRGQAQRLWEVLGLARSATWRAGGVGRVRFLVPVLRRGRRSAEMIALILVRGYGADRGPVITIALPVEAGGTGS